MTVGRRPGACQVLGKRNRRTIHFGSRTADLYVHVFALPRNHRADIPQDYVIALVVIAHACASLTRAKDRAAEVDFTRPAVRSALCGDPGKRVARVNRDSEYPALGVIGRRRAVAGGQGSGDTRLAIRAGAATTATTRTDYEVDARRVIVFESYGIADIRRLRTDHLIVQSGRIERHDKLTVGIGRSRADIGERSLNAMPSDRRIALRRVRADAAVGRATRSGTYPMATRHADAVNFVFLLSHRTHDNRRACRPAHTSVYGTRLLNRSSNLPISSGAHRISVAEAGGDVGANRLRRVCPVSASDREGEHHPRDSGHQPCIFSAFTLVHRVPPERFI